MNYFSAMKTHAAILMLITGSWLASAQTNEPALDEDMMLDSAQQWAQDNLDDDVLAALKNVDRAKVGDFLKNYQEQMQGDSVLDLAQLKAGAMTILPLLSAHKETEPYAAWLQERMDYFDVAAELNT